MIGIANTIFRNIKKISGGASTDPDAQAFITAAGITDATQKSAVNQLVLDLKSANIWTKMKAIYPIVGGTASTHKWNLKDPRDLDAAFRLTFSTGWTHSSTGMLPATAYADTFLIPSAAYGVDHNKHLSFYSRTNLDTALASSSIGSDNSVSGYCRFSVKTQGQTAMVYGGTNGTFSISNLNATGFYIANRSSSTASQYYKNGTLIGNGNATNSTTSNIPRKLLISAAFSVTSITYYDNKQCAFASIGDSLTAGEVTSFNTAVTTYQTTLGRNV
jgi:hypothetical protein